MTDTPLPGSALPAPPAAIVEPRTQAAVLLGVTEDIARRFGTTGLIELDGKPLVLQPLTEDPDGPWMASARARRPAAIDLDDWCDALLRANSFSLLGTEAAFGIDDDGDGVLVMRIPAGCGDARLLALNLGGLLHLCESVSHAVLNPAPQFEEVFP